MEIVNRIKDFMSAGQISSTQFADACGIPRPTLSQILSGRNRKISDEVISKIHEAYPQLNVLWLLFGEGKMLSSANTQISEGQTEAPRGGFGDDGGYSLFDDGGDERRDSSLREPLIFDDEPHREPAEPAATAAPAVAPQTQKQAGIPPVPMVQIPADGTKSIVNIVVFYSDDSFQNFVPR